MPCQPWGFPCTAYKGEFPVFSMRDLDFSQKALGGETCGAGAGWCSPKGRCSLRALVLGRTQGLLDQQGGYRLPGQRLRKAPRVQNELWVCSRDS